LYSLLIQNDKTVGAQTARMEEDNCYRPQRMGTRIFVSWHEKRIKMAVKLVCNMRICEVALGKSRWHGRELQFQ
jgi:hypothetical protein